MKDHCLIAWSFTKMLHIVKTHDSEASELQLFVLLSRRSEIVDGCSQANDEETVRPCCSVGWQYLQCGDAVVQRLGRGKQLNGYLWAAALQYEQQDVQKQEGCFSGR